MPTGRPREVNVSPVRDRAGAPTLIGSSPTLKDCEDMIERFYCGSRKELRPHPTEANRWNVFGPKGLIEAVTVRMVRGRYRFFKIG